MSSKDVVDLMKTNSKISSELQKLENPGTHCQQCTILIETYLEAKQVVQKHYSFGTRARSRSDKIIKLYCHEIYHQMQWIDDRVTRLRTKRP